MRVICLENLLLRFLHKVFKILQGHKKITQLIFIDFFGFSHLTRFGFYAHPKKDIFKKNALTFLMIFVFSHLVNFANFVFYAHENCFDVFNKKIRLCWLRFFSRAWLLLSECMS